MASSAVTLVRAEYSGKHVGSWVPVPAGTTNIQLLGQMDSADALNGALHWDVGIDTSLDGGNTIAGAGGAFGEGGGTLRDGSPSYPQDNLSLDPSLSNVLARGWITTAQPTSVGLNLNLTP